MGGIINGRFIKQDEVLVGATTSYIKATAAFSGRFNPG